MTVLTLLVLLGLFMWCGALTRRLGAGAGCHCLGEESTELRARDRQLSELREAYSQLEHEMHDRIMELEERLDFAERAMTRQASRAGSVSAGD